MAEPMIDPRQWNGSIHPLITDLTEGYTSALREYLSGAGEAALRRALEFGRRALAEGMGVLDMASLHQKCVVSLLGKTEPDLSSNHLKEGAFKFFVESLSPYEVFLRGLQEADAKLRHSLRELMLAEEALRRQNDKRMAANQALEEERKRYRELFEFAPDAYLVTDLEGNIREANSAAAALLETRQDLLAGRSLSDFAFYEDREILQEQLLEFKLGDLGKREDWQISMQPAGGRVIPLAVTIGAERGSGGALTGLRWLLRDATQRKREEQERTEYLVSQTQAEAARRFEFLARASSLLASSLDYEATLAGVARLAVPYLADWCFVYVFDEHGGIYQLPPAHADTIDPDLEQELDRLDLLQPRKRKESSVFNLAATPKMIDDLNAQCLENLAGSAAAAQVFSKLGFRRAMMVPFVTRDRPMGALTLVAAQSARCYSHTDLALAEDLAHRCALAIENARLYWEVTRERDKAERASRAKDEFLAILSHELKNPLMPLKNWTRILKNNPLMSQDATLAEGVRSLERNVQNISRLVSDCLDLARISQGKIEMKSETVDLNQTALAAMEAVLEMARNKKLKLVADFSSAPLWLNGDSTRLQQVIMNLLVNAIKYTGSGGTISIRSSRFEDLAEVAVTDTGVGIDAGFLEHIFEPFRQGSRSWLTSESGLGLGLAISKRIVEMHNGRIWAESRGLGTGSTFHVRLAMAAASLRESERVPAPVPVTHQTKGLKILVIEDSPDILFLMKLELEVHGFSVLAARDGIKGLEIAREALPDMIISDVKMPGIDGYELIKMIRAIPELARTPAIALTGFGMRADMQKLRGAGFDACLSKPAATRDIILMIQELASKQDLLSRRASAIESFGAGR
jgi:PAS domain S-box-containing protein